MPPHSSLEHTLSGQHRGPMLDELLKAKCYTRHVGQDDGADSELELGRSFGPLEYHFFC